MVDHTSRSIVQHAVFLQQLAIDHHMGGLLNKAFAGSNVLDAAKVVALVLRSLKLATMVSAFRLVAETMHGKACSALRSRLLVHDLVLSYFEAYKRFDDVFCSHM